MLNDSEPPIIEHACKEISIVPEVEPLRPDHVHARTDSWMATQTSGRPWKEKYATRLASLEGGALSKVGVPFKVIGGEVSGIQEMLAMTFQDSFPESFPAELQEKYKDLGSEQETNRSKTTTYTPSKSVLELGDPNRYRAAGFDAIKELLQETTERMVGGRGGEPYMEQLEKIKKRKQAAIDAIFKQNPQYPVVRELSNETLRKIYITKELEKEEETVAEDEDEEEEEMEENEVMGTLCSFETLHLSNKFFLEKLTCVLTLLSSLHNLQRRHLKTRKPLNRDVVISLRQFPFEKSEEEKGSPGIPIPDIQQPKESAKDPLSSSSLPAINLVSSVSSTLSGSNLSWAADSRHLVSAPSGSRLRVGGAGVSSTKIARQRVEVWEELLAVETGEMPGKSPPIKYRAPWQQNLTRDSLQLHLSGGQKKKRTTGRKSKIALLTGDAGLLVPNFLEFLALTREKVRRKTLQDLEKVESCRLEKFHLLFQSLRNLDEIPEKYFPRMRRLLGETKTEYTVEWFRRLVDEADSLQVSKDSTVSDLLKKLKHFVYKQPMDQPLYKEKMCLLVFSLPADEVCRPAWQSALIFVMNRVLEWKLEVLKSWLSTRHLYILKYIEDAS